MAAKKKSVRKKLKPAGKKPKTGSAARKKRGASAAGRKSPAKKSPSRKSAAGKKKAGNRAAAGRTAKKKPTKKSAKKKAAKKKPVAPGKRSVTGARAAQPAAELSVPEAPRPVSIPGAWPFPMGNRP
jgi:hypothetical protein